ncbi:hypothetical protein DFQ28_009584 [Apophysomyces sp. BC1034]|nr:hypothetical protein DFQ30_009280 [Apophysomyces sp. BC1015]KAG0172695.1 hypothetical protein DFQ29_008273 [Apophysomyces sp. BC1021]KAG0185291.1 hypothetical protein DFQ28_009584 [Apophysomyces sp. BC1034]
MHYVIGPIVFEIGFDVNPAVAKDVVSSAKIPDYTERIITGLDRGFANLFPPTDSIVIQNPNDFFQKFIAYMSVPSLVGCEVEANPHVLASFANFTGDVTNNVPILMLVPKVFHPFILPYLQSTKHHHQVMRDHIVPIIRRRRAKMADAAAHGEPHGLQLNFLQGLMEYVKPDGSHYSDDDVAQSILLVAFASVHTTSMNMAFALYWLLARPDLYKELEIEIKEVLGDEPVTHQRLEKMAFLNAFIREALRYGVDKLAHGRKVLQDFTFANGYQVPKGRTVQTTNRLLNLGLNTEQDTLQGMDPTRSLNRGSTTPARDFVTFGLGKHLCPGRFFAVHEIKLSLVSLLRQYNITTLSGKTPQPVQFFGGSMVMTCNDPLLFTRKK